MGDSDGAVSVKLSNHHGLIIAERVEGKFPFHSSWGLLLIILDVYPKWIIIVPGRRTASRISHSRISSGSCFTQWLGCLGWSRFYGNGRR